MRFANNFNPFLFTYFRVSQFLSNCGFTISDSHQHNYPFKYHCMSKKHKQNICAISSGTIRWECHYFVQFRFWTNSKYEVIKTLYYQTNFLAVHQIFLQIVTKHTNVNSLCYYYYSRHQSYQDSTSKRHEWMHQMSRQYICDLLGDFSLDHKWCSTVPCCKHV